jgi:hypothetical protein
MNTPSSLRSALHSQLRSLCVRSIETKGLVDTFLVCTVVTILAVRFFLIALGYPQLGGDGLHIAHLLWGGLLMLVALLLMLVSLSQVSRRVAAVLAGVGFGLLIDEIGKFVTSDNNYFFKPTFALIYVALVLVWLASRTLLLRTELHPDERLANAIDLLRESAVRPLTDQERQEALRLLDQSAGEQSFVQGLRDLFENTKTVHAVEHPGRRLMTWVNDRYERLVTTRGFKLVILLVFVALGVVAVLSVASLAVTLVQEDTLTFTKWAQFVTNIVLSVFYGLGIYALFRRSRLTAYRWFEVSILFNIFVVQIFDFADIELWGVLELFVSIVLFVTLRILIAEEERRGATLLKVAPASVTAVLERVPSRSV